VDIWTSFTPFPPLHLFPASPAIHLIHQRWTGGLAEKLGEVD
jgi:hypothetical protein